MELNEKIVILEFLLKNYDDGRRKSFYCLAVNLLGLSDVKDVMEDINKNISKLDIGIKDKIEQIIMLFESKAKKEKVVLNLRKQIGR